jgi:hypothetical protein
MSNLIVEAKIKGKITDEEREQASEFRALIVNGIENENPLAVATFMIFYPGLLSEVEIENNEVFLDGLTAEQWKEKYKQRLKEHCIAGSYYNPNKPVDLSQLTERWKKFLDLIEDKEQRSKVATFMDEEDYSIVINKAAIFWEMAQEIMGVEKGGHKGKKNIQIVNEYPFLIEDFCGRAEAVEKKLEEAERERERDNPTVLPLSLILTNKLMIR